MPLTACALPRINSGYPPGDFAFSGEARQLREQFVRSPWLVDPAFVCSLFKSLFLVDKNVCPCVAHPAGKYPRQIEHVGDISHLSTLEELSLTGNRIEQLPGSYLPDTLQVCAAATVIMHAHRGRSCSCI